jgi:hypothetical protein
MIESVWSSLLMYILPMDWFIDIPARLLLLICADFEQNLIDTVT